MDKICGFVVVRTPERAIAPYHNPNYRLGSKCYQGVDRLAWEDLKQKFYEKELSESLISIHAKIKSQEANLFGVQVIRNFNLAQQIAGLNKECSEIIAVYSSEMEQCVGIASDGLGGINLQEIGKDCFAIGEWSLILRGIFARPEKFGHISDILNSHGLVEKCSNCEVIFENYMNLASNETVEPLMKQSKISCITIYKVEPVKIC